MAAHTSSATIKTAYNDLLDPHGDCSWIIVGTTPASRLELLSRGAQGLTELRTRLIAGRSLHGLLNVEGRVLFWSQIPDELTGVKRARALVQARHVASLFPHHDATVTFAAPGDLEPALVAIKLFHQQSTHSPTIRVESPHTFEERRPSIPETLDMASAPRRSLEKIALAQPALPPKAMDQPAYPPHLATAPHIAHYRERSDSLSSRASSKSVSASQRPVPPPMMSSPTAGYLSASAASPTSTPHYLSPSTIRLNGLAISAEPSPPVSPAYPPPVTPRSDQLASPSSPPGVLDSAAAAMLVSSPSDSSIALSLQEVPIDIGEDELASRRSTMQVFAGEAVPTRRLGANDLRASVYPTESPMVTSEPEEIYEPDPPANPSHRLSATASDLRTQVPASGATATSSATDTSMAERTQAVAISAAPDGDAEQAETRTTEEARRRAAADEAHLQELAEAERTKREAEEAEQQRAVEAAEAARFEAARIEAEEAAQRAEAERVRAEEAQRVHEEALRQAEEEETRRLQQLQEEERQADVARKNRLAAARDAGEVMMEGTVNVQANDSVMWKRRFFRLDRHAMTLHKTERAADEVFLTIPLDDIKRVTTNPEEALVPHSFKLRLQDGGGVLFYYNTAVETERLVEAVRCALEKGSTPGEA